MLGLSLNINHMELVNLVFIICDTIYKLKVVEYSSN